MGSQSSLLAMWRRAGSRSGIAIVDDARGETSWRELVRNSSATAGRLRKLAGIAPGERVGLLLSPGASFVESFFGVLAAGGVVVVLSPLHPDPETTYFCDHARVRTILVSTGLAGHLGHTTAAARRVLTVSDTGESSGSASSSCEADAEMADVPPETAALQLYTSGTTGRPKGAVITHANLTTQSELLATAWDVKPRDTLLHALPLHHMHGLAIALLTAISAGATTRMLSAFDAERVWNEMSHATMFMAVPTMYQRLFASFDRAPEADRLRWTVAARALRLATSGSASLPVGLAERWRTLTGEIPLERFGMTEIGVGMSNPLIGTRKAGHVGTPLPTVETRIMGDDGSDASSGELWIKGPGVFAGYFEDAEATRAAFPEDGWFRTGDTVMRGADGYFKVLGRTSVDILKSGGYKLSALEIEEALREHPAIAEVAVVGVPDEAWGDRVVACVVPRPGRASECATEAVRAFAKEKLAVYKVPKQVVCMDDLPRNMLGKVMKPALLRRLTSSHQ